VPDRNDGPGESRPHGIAADVRPGGFFGAPALVEAAELERTIAT